MYAKLSALTPNNIKVNNILHLAISFTLLIFLLLHSYLCLSALTHLLFFPPPSNSSLCPSIFSLIQHIYLTTTNCSRKKARPLHLHKCNNMQHKLYQINNTNINIELIHIQLHTHTNIYYIYVYIEIYKYI